MRQNSEGKARDIFYASEQRRESQRHNNDGRIPEKETSDETAGRERSGHEYDPRDRHEACGNIICLKSHLRSRALSEDGR